MQSISHWGMFWLKEPSMFMCLGYKLPDGSKADWETPGAIVEIVPIDHHGPQPMYLRAWA